MPDTWDSLSPVRALMDRVLELGLVRVALESKSKGVRLRQQISVARAMDRAQSREAYGVEDERHGYSPYDKLQMSLESDASEGVWYLVISVNDTRLSGVLAIYGPDGNKLD